MHDLHVTKTGHGPPILVLHGLLSDHTQMAPVLPALKGYTIHLADLFGHGKSSKEPSASIVQENAAHLLSYCVEHNIHTVLAYSISSLVALEMRLPNTIIIAGFSRSPLSEGPLKKLYGKEETIQQYVVRYREYIYAMLKRLHMNKLPGISEADMACAVNYMIAARKSYEQQAGELKRVLCIHGTKDQLIVPQLGEELARQSSAQLVMVPEDHASVLGNPSTHRAIKEFLEQTRFDS